MCRKPIEKGHILHISDLIMCRIRPNDAIKLIMTFPICQSVSESDHSIPLTVDVSFGNRSGC